MATIDHDIEHLLHASTDLNDPYNPEKGYTGGWYGHVTRHECPVCEGVRLRHHWIDESEELWNGNGYTTRTYVTGNSLRCPKCDRRTGYRRSVDAAMEEAVLWKAGA